MLMPEARSIPAAVRRFICSVRHLPAAPSFRGAFTSSEARTGGTVSELRAAHGFSARRERPVHLNLVQPGQLAFSPTRASGDGAHDILGLVGLGRPRAGPDGSLVRRPRPRSARHFKIAQGLRL
jgi:hypothetical protein